MHDAVDYELDLIVGHMREQRQRDDALGDLFCTRESVPGAKFRVVQETVERRVWTLIRILFSGSGGPRTPSIDIYKFSQTSLDELGLKCHKEST